MKQTTLPSASAPTATTPESTPQANTAINTRRNATAPTTQEIIQQHNEVKDAISGKTYLERMALAISGKPYATDATSEILFHITQMKGVPLSAQTAIRAVAFIIEEQTALKIADSVAKHTITALAPHVAKIQEESNKLTQISQDLAGIQDISTRLDQIQQTVDQITTHVKDSPTPPTSSYKMALMAGLGNEDQNKLIKVTARNAIKTRQVTLKLSTDSPLATGKITHDQLVAKVKAALVLVAKEGAPELTLKMANQYRSNIVLEFASEAAAIYLRKPSVKRTFTDALDPSATLKDQAFTVILQFIPLSFNINQHNLSELEKENGWKEGTILTARWVKAPEKRTKDQQFAHIMASIADAQTANLILRDGFTLHYRKLQAKKNKREPIRCAKCQRYANHIASECQSQRDVCANCAGEHRTSSCTEKHKKHCVSCDTNDHASWDRQCPEFRRKCESLDDHYPENTMPYFQTDEPWTQVMIPSKPSAPPPPPPPHHSYPASLLPEAPPPPSFAPRYRQTTLDQHAHRGRRSYRGRSDRQMGHTDHYSPGPPRDDRAPWADYENYDRNLFLS